MKAMTYTAVMANLAQTMDEVCANHSPVIITRNASQSVVLLSLEDYQALEENAYLLRSKKNARRIFDAIDELKSGKGIRWKLPAE